MSCDWWYNDYTNSFHPFMRDLSITYDGLDKIFRFGTALGVQVVHIERVPYTSLAHGTHGDLDVWMPPSNLGMPTIRMRKRSASDPTPVGLCTPVETMPPVNIEPLD